MLMKYYIVRTDWDNGVAVDEFSSREEAEAFLSKENALDTNSGTKYRVFYGQERTFVPREVIQTIKII